MRVSILAAALLLAPLSLNSCVASKKEPTKAESAKASKYIIDAAPAGMIKLGTNFDNKVTLLGYKLKSKAKVFKPGQKVEYTLYWKADKDIKENGWKLFTHVLNAKDKKLINIDAVGPIRAYTKGKQVAAPSTWHAGKIYVDEQSFNVPKKYKGSKVKIITGLWKGDRRMPVLGKKKSDRAVVATLTVKANKKRSTRVPKLRVNKLEQGQAIKIDGKLDEAAWATAAKTGAFVNVKTGKKAATAKVQGKARITWNDEAIFLGFNVEDSDIIGGFKAGSIDPQLWTKDTVEIMIDPDGDGDNKDYYEIQVGPQNLVFDSQFDSYNKPKAGPKGPFGHQDWSSKLTSAVAIDGTLDKPGDKDKGYTVEIRIPWASLGKAKQSPPKLGDTWRMNFYAMQNNGGVAWSPILGQGNFHKASRFGRILWADKDWKPTKQLASLAAKNAEALKGLVSKDVLALKPGAALKKTANAPKLNKPVAKAPAKVAPGKAVSVKPPALPKAPTPPKAPVTPAPAKP